MATQGVFINICARIWKNGGTVTADPGKLSRILRCDKQMLSNCLALLKTDDLLVEKQEANGVLLTVKFLDKLLGKSKMISIKRAEAGRKGGQAIAKQMPSKRAASPEPDPEPEPEPYKDPPTPLDEGVLAEPETERETGTEPPERKASCDRCRNLGTIPVVVAQVPGGPKHLIKDTGQVRQLCGEFKGKNGKKEQTSPNIWTVDWPCNCEKGVAYNASHVNLDQDTLEKGWDAHVETGILSFLESCKQACLLPR